MSILIQSMRSLLIQFPPPPAPCPQTHGGTPLQESASWPPLTRSLGLPHTLRRRAPRPGGGLAALGHRHRPRPGVAARLPASC